VPNTERRSEGEVPKRSAGLLGKAVKSTEAKLMVTIFAHVDDKEDTNISNRLQ
jgi:hypothetical protein